MLLPSGTLFELPAKRTMLASFPSQLEYFKDAYARVCIASAERVAAQSPRSASPTSSSAAAAALQAAKRPLQSIIDLVDRELDNGLDCRVVRLENLNLDDFQFRNICAALYETFKYTPVPSQVFVNNFSCKELRIGGNPRLTGDGYAALKQLLEMPSFPAIALDVSNANIATQNESLGLAQAIAASRNLQNLDVSGNSLSGKPAVDIIKALPKCTRLRVLVWSNCGLRDGTCSALGLVLQSHPSIESVDVSNNLITDSGAKEILLAIDKRPALCVLTLSNTKVSKKTAKRVAQRASEHGRPHTVGFANCALAPKAATHISTVLSVRGPQVFASLLLWVDDAQRSLTIRDASATWTCTIRESGKRAPSRFALLLFVAFRSLICCFVPLFCCVPYSFSHSFP